MFQKKIRSWFSSFLRQDQHSLKKPRKKPKLLPIGLNVENLEPRLTPDSRLFNYTGSLESWIVPTDVTAVQISIYGASGGAGGYDGGTSGGAAGNVGYVSGTMNVNPGDILKFYIGASGNNGFSSVSGYGGGTGGTNSFTTFSVAGGAGGNAGNAGTSGGGGGGGSASVVEYISQGVTKYIVAGGGGGGGGAANGPVGTQGITGNISSTFTSGRAGQNTPFNYDGGGGGGGGGGYNGATGGGGIGGSILLNGEYVGQGGNAGANFTSSIAGLSTSYSANNTGHGFATISYSFNSPNFKAQTTFATWNKAGKVITADVNNDGKQDMVVQNIGYALPNSGPRYDYVSVFLGKGDGGFGSRIDTPTGSYSNWLGSGDFNGDGKVDFVTPNYCGESITILLGRGDGTFSRNDMSNAGGTISPSFVTTGDVDGDGKIDILTTNQNSSNISVFLGRGDGTFQTPNVIPTSAIPNRIVLGDFNTDGKTDLVVHTNSGNVSTNTLFLGAGAGSFSSNSTIGITGELTVGDFNRDGSLDLAGTEANTVKVLLGNGNATFKNALNFSANGVGASITATDINGDGSLDLQLTQFNNNTVAVLVGNGDGTFKSPLTFGTGTNPFTVASADFNNDGKRDLVVSNLNSNNLSVLLHLDNTAPTLTTITTLSGASEDSTYSITYDALLAAANEYDAEGNSISFRIESVANGILTKNGVTIVAGATLLGPGESLSWTPAPNANGTINAFTVKAFDGGLVSSSGIQVAVNVTALNDAPVGSSATTTLAAINEDVVNPPGSTVQNLFGGLFSDSADNQRQAPVTETFTNSTDGWVNGILDSTSSQSWGSFLGRFGMNAEISKTFAIGGVATTISFEFMRIDSWDGELFRLYANDNLIINQPFTGGQITNTLSGSASGFTWTMAPADYGYKANAGWDDQKFLVTLNVPSGINNLNLRLNSTLDQDANDESWGIDNFNLGIGGGDGSIANSFAGVAISNYTVDAARGSWQYSTNGTNWLNLQSASTSTAITLKPADYLRFVPVANYNGQATSISVNLIETGGSAITSGATVSLGASTVYSPTPIEVNHTVIAVNDAPRVTTSTVTLAPVFEDVGNAASGARVSDLFIYVMDDSTDNGQASLAGVAISSHQPDASKGAWQYSSNGSIWVALPGADLSTAVTLRATDYLRFVPAANYYGQATALSANIIETGGAAISSGATVNIAGVGSQLVLASGNVIGWSSVYSGSFAADNVVDEQSGSIVADNFGDNYWLASDGTGSASILIDLGVATTLSKIDLYNTTNTGYNDRGTSNFHIEVANAITGNSATSYALANGVTVASGTMAYENVGVAPAPQSYALSTGGTAYRYVRFVVDTSKNNNPGLHELRLFGVGTGVGGSTVYSQQAVSVNHTITPVNDTPVIGGLATTVNYIATDFATNAANAVIGGSAVVSNGECVLTPASSGTQGYLLFNTLASNPTAFSAHFDYRVADGSGADGTSFNYGVINGLGNLYENGITNSGLVVSFIEWGSQRVEVKFNGGLLQTANVNLVGVNYQKVAVKVDGSNKISVAIGGATVISDLDLGSSYANADKSFWQFGFASRCGGANNKHSIDNLVISNNVAPVDALEQGSTILVGALTLGDVDNPTLASATVAITDGLRNSEDVLGFVGNSANYGNIAGVYNPSTGVLALTSQNATATLAQWQAALRSVTYTNTSDNPNSNNRLVSFQVNDGISNSSASTVTVKVTPVNDAPVANAQTITPTEDTTYTGSLTGSDVEGGPLTYSVVAQGSKGVVTITNAATGAFSYVPNANANGVDSFTFKVNDGSLDSVVAVVTVNITPVNDAPVANAQTITPTEDTTYTGSLTGSDVEGSPLTYSVVAQGSKGVVTITNAATGAFTYVPNGNANGADSFTFKVNDGSLDSVAAVVTVNITPVNDAPVANAQTITPTEDTTYTGSLTGSDVEGSPLTYSVVAQGSKGVVTITNAATGAFTYVPNGNANGADSFTFKVNDGSLDSAVVSVTVNITPVNDTPVVSASQPSVTLLDYQFTRNWGVDQSFVTITKSDPDGFVQYDDHFFAANGWTSSDNGVTVTKNLTYGYARLRPSTNVLTYYLDQGINLTNRLRQGQTVTETIPVQVTDGQLTALTNVVFTIDGQNDEPELYRVNNLVGATEDSEYEITYSALTNSSQLADIDGGVTAFVVKNVTSGVLKIGSNAQSAIPWNASNNSVISTGLNGYWTPTLNANGLLAAFTVVVKDDGGLESLNPLQVHVQVAPVNDLPVVGQIAAVTYRNNNGLDVFSNDTGAVSASDVDSGTNLRFGISGQNVNVINGKAVQVGKFGTFAIDLNSGEYTFRPDQVLLNALRADDSEIFTITVGDGIATVNADYRVHFLDLESPEAPAEISFKQDSGFSATDGITSDNILEINGLAESGSQVEIFDGNRSLGIVQAGLNRKWNFITPLLADGSHQLFARATDASGNRSPNSQVVTVMVDTVAPASPTGITITPDTGSNSKDGIINVGFFSISGVSESGSVIELTGDSILSKGGYSALNGPWNVGLTKSSQNGEWSYAYDGTHIVGTKIDPTKGTTISLNELRLPTGEYPLEVRAIDAAGNRSAATQFLLKIDRNAPTGSIITLRNGQDIPSGTVQTGTDRQVQVVFDENVLDNLSLENFTTTGSVVLKEIRRIDSRSFLLTMDVVKEGTFTIALSAGSTMDVAGNPSTLISATTLRSDVSWSFETSTSMSSGVPVTGFSDGAKDEDFFKYTASTNGSLLVNATGLNSNFDPFLTAFVRNTQGGYDALMSDDNSAGGTAARLRFNTESGKQYFLKVSSLKALPGSFLLTAQEGQRVEDDFGNSRTSANVVTFDGNGSLSQLGSIERSADIDFFKFTTRQAGQVILSVQGSGRESLASGALGIFEASGNPINPTQVDNGFQFPVEAGKTYFFSMESSDGTTGDYLVRGTMEAFLTFTNNSAKAVGALTQGVQDLFKFIAPSTGLYAFHSEDRVTSSIPTFSVLDANRNTISNLSDFGFGPLGTSTGTANANLTVGQTYYLRVGGGNYEGAYEVSARPDDVGSREPSLAQSLNFLGTTGRVDVAGDGDLYRVTYSNTSNTDVVRFRVTQKANLGVQSRLDSQLYVSVDNGTSWVNSTQLTGSLDNRVELVIRPGLTENILVWAGGNGGSTGEYELNYEAVTDDLPDQISDIPLNAPPNLIGDLVSGTFGGTINFAGDIDVRKYTAKMDGTFVLDLTTNSTSLDPVLAIYDRNGVLIAKDNDSGAGLNSRLTIETKSGAEYFLRFSDFAGKAQNQAYTLKITQESKQDDHGDNIKFATDLVLNTAGVATSKGEILTRQDGNDTDYFRFTATDSTVFNFGVTRDLQSKDLVPTFKVLKDDQSVLFSGALQANGSSSLGRANLVAGNTYYIQVQGGLDAGQMVSQGGYILAVAKYVPPVTVADDYANTFNTNTTPAVGVLSISQNNGSIVGEITSTKDVDVFRFVPDVSGLVRIDLKSDTGSKLDTILSVLNSNGEQVDTNDNFSNSTNSQLILDVNSGTTYYLSASNFNGTLGKYTLGIQSIEAQDSDGAGNNVGAIDAQHTLTLDSLNKAAKFDAINSTGDRDLFKLEVTSAGILNLGLNADGTSKLDGFLRIYKNNLNTLVATDDNSGLGFNSMVAISVTNGDVIYIQTSGVGSSQGNYKVWARLDSDDHGNTISSATLLQNEGNFADTIGEINQIGDSDYFKFVAEYTEVIQVYLYADVGSELNTYLNVYDSNGSLLDYNNDQNGIDFLAATDSAIFLQVEQGQTYYFEVKGASQTIGAYCLSVEPIFDDFGNSMEDAEIISLVSNTISQTGEIEIAGDQDVFKFVALTSGNYTFAVGGTNSNEDIDTFLQILDENGNVIASNDDAPGSNSTDSFLRFDLLADETYYARVSSYGDSHGAYRLDIAYDPSASADDHGNTTSTATPFVIDGNSATLAGAIGYNGDVDVFSTVVTENATIRIESSFANASLNGALKVLINRNDNIIQVGSDEGTSQEVTFQVLGGDEIFVSYTASSLINQSASYSIAITESAPQENAERPVDQKSVDDIAGELITGFNSVASNLNENSDLQQESQRITDLLVQSWFASMDTDGDGQLGQSYLIIWLDPVDFALNTPSGQVGSSGGSSVIENSAASLSSKGALDMVVVSGAQASQYNLQLTGVGSGQVMAGATLITASGQVINPTVTGGSSSSGIASGSVPKSGMQLVLDFTPPSNGGGGNNGGGSSNGGNNNGGSNGNTVGDSSSVAESSSSSSGSSSGGGRSGGNSSLLNALSRAGNSISSVFEGAAEGLAGLALGGGGSATGGADEGALASEFVPGGTGTGNDLLVENKNENAPGSVSAAVKLAQVGVFVITTVSETYSESFDAVQTSITTEQAALKQIASIVDKAIPDVVPSEFEQALEKSLEKTTDLVLKEAKESVVKVGDLLADLVTARINQKPAKADAAAVNPAIQIAEANGEMVDQEFVAMAQSGLAIDFEFASDPLENHADLITGNQLGDSDFYFETSEWVGHSDRKSADEELLRGVGILAGVMLAPGVLSPALDHPVESDKSAKRKKPIRLKD